MPCSSFLMRQAAGWYRPAGLCMDRFFPKPLNSPRNGGYSWLKRGAEFRSLERVPTLSGETADLTRYPARRGFEDLVMLVSNAEAAFAWTAVTFPKERYVWFALKDPRVLRETILWL